MPNCSSRRFLKDCEILTLVLIIVVSTHSIGSLDTAVSALSQSLPGNLHGRENEFNRNVGTTAAPVLSASYLLAFHACDTAVSVCNNPQNHRTYVAQSNDGVTWSPVPGYVSHPGSVPDIIRRGNTVYVFNVNPATVRRFHITTNTWENPVAVQILRGGVAERWVDPSLILDDLGRIVIFYLVGQASGDPATCSPGETSCVKIFRSATEVDGSDGGAFNADAGNRAEEAITMPGIASDPDIFRGATGYVLYIARSGSIKVRTSNDLRGSYVIVPSLPDGKLDMPSGRSVSSGYYDPAASARLLVPVTCNACSTSIPLSALSPTTI